MKKIVEIILSIIIAFTLLSIEDNQAVNANTTGTITIEGLPSRNHTNAVGLRRGERHIRETIPYIVPAGTVVTLRQINGLNTSDLGVDVYNTDEEQEQEIKLSKTGSDLVFTVEYDSVIFIRVPRIEGSIEVEYEFSNTLQSIPYYIEGGSEDDFFTYWDLVDTPFGIIEGSAIVFLIPKADKEYIRDLENNSSHNNIDDMLAYYQDMKNEYDTLLGLEESPENPVHFNTPSVYFAKANASGPGTAYYGWYEIAKSSSSFGTAYLTSGWLDMHEVAHGYQQNDMMDKVSHHPNSISVREVWNNVFAHKFRSIEHWNGENAYTSNNISQTQLQYSREEGYNSGGFFEKLTFFTAIFDAVGYDGFIHFNREYRELGNESPSNADEYANSDYMALFFSEGSELNFIPHFEKSDIEIVEEIEDNARIRELNYAEFLNYLVLDENTRKDISSTLKLQADYELMDTALLRNEEFSNLNLVGDVAVNLNIDNIDEIVYKTVILKNGDYEIEKEITSNTVLFENVPVGVYRVLAPVSQSGDYKVDDQEIVTVTKELNTTITSNIDVNYLNFETPKLDNISSTNTITLTGLSNITFAEINTTNENISIRIVKRKPHSYFIDKEYADVKIYNGDNELIWERNFIGSVESAEEVIDIPNGEGYRIEVVHAEPDRMSITNDHTNLNFHNNLSPVVVSYESNGFYINNENKILEIIDTYATNVQNNEEQYYYHSNTYNTLQMINRLDQDSKEIYLEKYKEVTNNFRPEFNNIEDKYTYSQISAHNPSITNDIISNITAFDFEDGDLTSLIEIVDNNVDYSIPGNYIIQLKVKDNDKNNNYVDIVIEVIAEEKPEVIDPGGESIDSNLTQTGVKTFPVLIISFMLILILIFTRKSYIK